jgi:hypothetical protein
VDRFLARIDPAWLVVDFGCGDQYLASKHPNTINIDRVNNSGVSIAADLDWEFPESATGDVAVCSGLLEWLVYPLSFLSRLCRNREFKKIYLSYAGTKSDRNWQYNCTLKEIFGILNEFFYDYEVETWEGQNLIFATLRD